MITAEETTPRIPSVRVSRRRFIVLGATALSGWLIPGHAIASSFWQRDRALSFYNLHTGESVRATYWSDDQYVPEGVQAINYVMRDFHLNLEVQTDPRLLDLLYALHYQLDTTAPFDLISGYRSPATNAALRLHSEAVAVNSLHMYGMAADIRVPGRHLANVHRSASALRRGGVGYYPRANFVHVDVGRVRYWGA
ncbi:MAG: YcbK family protein [Candidatus Binataceae bacterium]|nr:YcbK family protein [Candidatus Binataceae bacterium]